MSSAPTPQVAATTGRWDPTANQAPARLERFSTDPTGPQVSTGGMTAATRAIGTVNHSR